MGVFDKLFGRQAPATSTPSASNAASGSEYRGVEVVIDDDHCCTAVKILKGRRFLSDEVPALPVDQCDLATCKCSYKLFNDRRNDVRRTGDLIHDVASEIYTDNNRNDDSTGRRSDD